jgi:hypothetical protein
MKPSEGYLKAKRQMVEAMDHRISELGKHIKVLAKADTRNNIYWEMHSRMEELESLRDYVRNTMLWNKKDGE